MKLLILASLYLTTIGSLVLRSIKPDTYPLHLIYVFLGFALLLLLSRIDFEIPKAFAPHLFVVSIIFISLPLLAGEVTRGVTRWVGFFGLSTQPSEFARPFIFLFLATLLSSRRVAFKQILSVFLIFAVSFILIAIQPSLGVAAMLGFGFLGMLFVTSVPKKYVIGSLVLLALLSPFVWGVMADYQKQRIIGLELNYNKIQSEITVGSGGFWGRGLGKGVQTQLSFLPEHYTDFIFASISEELGFLGGFSVILAFGVLLFGLTRVIKRAENTTVVNFVAAVLASLLAQVVVHIGMNMGVFPITGLPLPLVSAGGSSYLSTMLSLGLVLSGRNKVK